MQKFSLAAIKDLSIAISAVVIPIVVLVGGNQYSTALKERELEGEFVKLAISVLRETPSERNKNLRTWAVKVINEYSGVPLTETEKNDLIERIQIPSPVTSDDELKNVFRGFDMREIKEIQSSLSKLGFDSGPIDGYTGYLLLAEFSKFMREYGFRISEVDDAIKELHSLAASK